MIQRFFKLIYLIALVAIGLYLVGYPLTAINYDRIAITTYKAQCLSNSKDVVLQGMHPGEVYEFNEVVYEDTIFSDTKETLNFYCKYYDQVQPHIVAYNNTRTLAEQREANVAFWTLRQELEPNVYTYPQLYKLVPISEETNYYEILSPLVEALTVAIGWFVILQLARMAYIYIVFGEVAWHPFRLHK